MNNNINENKKPTNNIIEKTIDDLINYIDKTTIEIETTRNKINISQGEKYSKLTLQEIISEKVDDSSLVDEIIKYFREEIGINDFIAKLIFKDLSKYDDILNEFIKCLTEKTYDLENAIEINGYTAKKIHELDPSLKLSGVYTFMEFLRTDPKKAEETIKKDLKKENNN